MTKIEYKELLEHFSAVDWSGKLYSVNVFRNVEEIDGFYTKFTGADYRLDDGSHVEAVDSKFRLRDGTILDRLTPAKTEKNWGKGCFKI